jgi:hypothetical protein
MDGVQAAFGTRHELKQRCSEGSTVTRACASQTNLDMPGLRVLSISPPVMVIDNFVDADTCAAFVEAARTSEALQPSQIGASVLGDASNSASHRRTSTSLLLDQKAQQRYPSLRVRAYATHERSLQASCASSEYEY